jgi:hypothetical protein
MVNESIHYQSKAIFSLETARDALLPLTHDSVCHSQPEELRIHKGGSAVGPAGRPSSQALSHMLDVLKQREWWFLPWWYDSAGAITTLTEPQPPHDRSH